MTDYSPWVENDQIARRAQEAFTRHGLDTIRTPKDLEQLVTTIGGKPVEIHLVDRVGMETTTGYWIELPEVQRITLRKNDRPFYQTRSLHHEFAHIIMNHPRCVGHNSDPSTVTPDAASSVVDGALSRSIQDFESSEDAESEGEAECLAGLIAKALLHPTYLDDERIFG
jgi:hypothetical protein